MPVISGGGSGGSGGGGGTTVVQQVVQQGAGAADYHTDVLTPGAGATTAYFTGDLLSSEVAPTREAWGAASVCVYSETAADLSIEFSRPGGALIGTLPVPRASVKTNSQAGAVLTAPVDLGSGALQIDVAVTTGPSPDRFSIAVIPEAQ